MKPALSISKDIREHKLCKDPKGWQRIMKITHSLVTISSYGFPVDLIREVFVY